MKEWFYGFEPVIDNNSKVLILGSFPSVKSREQGFYYGNPQNRFWRVLEYSLNKPVPTDIKARKSFLLENKIALWDVIESSCIQGSMDADLNESNSKPVDFDLVFKSYPSIKLIILNGKKAYAVFKKFNADCKIENIYLPSTSPANARFNYEAWKEILNKYL